MFVTDNILRGWDRAFYLLLLAVAAVCSPIQAMAADPAVWWVSKARGDNSYAGDDLGDTNHPFATIQAAVNKASAGDTIKIEAGIYDEGETYKGAHSNRVAITKRLVLEGVDGKENTHIVGFRDFVNGGTLGCCKSSVRCVWIDRANAAGTVLKNLTIRDGGANTADGSSHVYYSGGGVQGTTAYQASSESSYTSSCLVDCVVSNCAAGSGAGINGVNAVRCLITGNVAPSYGAGSRCSRMWHCLVTKNRTTNSGARGALYYCYAYNCTITANTGAKTPGAESSWLYNTVSYGNEGSNVINAKSTINSFTSASVAYLYDVANGDYRLSPGTKAVGGGLTEHLSLVALPDGVSAYKDYVGNDIDPESETCDAGCMQGVVIEDEKTVTITAANGGIAVSGAVIGENTLTVGDVVTITPAAGTRPCTGVTVNGVEYLFDDTPSVGVTIAAEFPSSFTISAVYTKHWYVDANVANDDGTGFRAGDPMKTLTNALAHAVSGDTVHAAAGRYEEGSTAVSGTRRCRAAVPEGVTLVADEGPDVTFIIGAPATDPLDSAGLGLGTNAVSCVRVAKNGHVRGFTLTGGHTDYTTSTDGISSIRYAGGAACGIAESTREYQFVEDCIISNNFASYGGAGRAVTLVRCRVFDNKALNNGGGIVICNAYGTLFDRNRQGSSSSTATCRNITKLFGCTITPANLTLAGTATNRAISAVTSEYGQFHGCLILGSVNDGGRLNFDTPSTYCVFSGSRDGFPTNEGCVVVSSAVAKELLDAEFRPVVDGNTFAVDAWDSSDFSTYAASVLSTGKDLSGAPRIRNGRIDIGALESDPKPWYAKLLDGKGRNITVTEADNMVTNIANGVTLQDGMAVSLTWASPVADAVRTGHVRVAGEGSLTVTKDGAPYATYTEADGEVEFSFAATGKSAALVFSFEGEGSADVYSLSSPIGMMLMLN